MPVFAKEPLREVENEEQAQRLLRALRKDWPHSVHMVNSIESVLHWKKTASLRQGAEWQCAVYRYEGDGDSSDGEATAVTITRAAPYYRVVAVHTTDATGAALRRVLADSSLLPWGEDFLFESVHERCIPALAEEVRRRGDAAPGLYPTTKVFLPREDALKLDVSCPADYVLLPLEAKHGASVRSTWHVGYRVGALEWIQSGIVRNRGLSWGVFPRDKTQGEPVAHILGEVGGFLRILHTSDEHRRKGLGALVTRAACRALAETGKDLYADIMAPNPASEATFAKLGFKRICESSFVLYHAPPRGGREVMMTSK